MLNGADVCYKSDTLLSSGLHFFFRVCIIALLYAVFGIYCEILMIKSCILNDNDEIMIEDLLNLM